MMKWFQHQTNAHRDPKLVKLMRRYGADAYALYFFCLELIASDVGSRYTFDLEHDAELIAYELRIDTLRVEEIMREMVRLGLFEDQDGRITCWKLANYLASSGTRNPEVLQAIAAAKGRLSETVSDNSRLSQPHYITLHNNTEDKTPQKRAKARVVRPESVDQTVWDDFVAQRRTQRAPISATALKSIQSEADKAGVSLSDALEICLARGWRGFKAEWLTPRSPVVVGEPVTRETSRHPSLVAERRGTDDSLWRRMGYDSEADYVAGVRSGGV